MTSIHSTDATRMNADLKYCVLCDAELVGKSLSAEHLIPESIGGNWATSGFICVNCNSRTGHEWDAVLAQRLAWLISKVGIRKAQRIRPVRVETADGERLTMRSDGTYVPTKPILRQDEQGWVAQITARTMEEARTMVEGLGRRRPEVNVEKTLRAMRLEERYAEQPFKVRLDFDGPEVAHSIIKTAVGVAITWGISPAACDLAIVALRGPVDVLPFSLFYDRDLVERKADEILHIVSLSGDPATGMLLAYVEYFGALRAIVVLNLDYGGPRFSHTYAIDPSNGEEVVVQVDLALTTQELASILANEGVLVDEFRRAIGSVMGIVKQRSDFKNSRALIRSALAESLKELEMEPGDGLSPSQAQVLSEVFSRRVAERIRRLSKALGAQDKVIELLRQGSDLE